MRKVTLATALLLSAGAAQALTTVPSAGKTAASISLSPKANQPIILVSQPQANAAAVVPEPSTWAMLVVGFGLAGFGMRRRRVAMVAA